MFENIVLVLNAICFIILYVCVWLLMKCSIEALRRIQRLEQWSYRDSVYGLIYSLFYRFTYTEDTQERINIMKRIHELVEELKDDKKPQSEGRHN